MTLPQYAPGLAKVADCDLCIKGFYCPHNATTLAVIPCPAGFFCPPGVADFNQTQFKCPTGNYCPSGSSVPIDCAPGTYQALVGHS
eukprot:gene36028-44437_t